MNHTEVSESHQKTFLKADIEKRILRLPLSDDYETALALILFSLFFVAKDVAALLDAAAAVVAVIADDTGAPAIGLDSSHSVVGFAFFLDVHETHVDRVLGAAALSPAGHQVKLTRFKGICHTTAVKVTTVADIFSVSKNELERRIVVAVVASKDSVTTVAVAVWRSADKSCCCFLLDE